MIPLTIDARSLLVPLALCSGVAHATPLGDPMDEAVAVQVTGNGLDRIAEVVQAWFRPRFRSLAVVRI